MNGYATLHPVGLDVRADMLESVAGLDEQGMETELAFALNTFDWNDPDSMKWVASLIARRVAEIEG